MGLEGGYVMPVNLYCSISRQSAYILTVVVKDHSGVSIRMGAITTRVVLNNHGYLGCLSRQ